MLRISITSPAENTAMLWLEGHLAGVWIEELRHTCDQMLATGGRVILDLGGVSLIERPGVDLLASLSRRSVALTHCSPFQQEQIRQAVAATSETTTLNEPA
jgi:anti-anti-sigma regulatory factor